jgi:hypothetical protein
VVPAAVLARARRGSARGQLGGRQPGRGIDLAGRHGRLRPFILLAGHSETIRGLRGDGRDERFAQIDLRATAVAGLVLIVTLIVAWLTEIAQGHSGSPYTWLCAVGGLSYALAVAFFRWRG